MSIYNIGDIVYCTNTTCLRKKCIIRDIVQDSMVAEETVYEVQSLSPPSHEVLLVSEDGVTSTPVLGIKQLRVSTGLSQAKFAHKFEIPTRTLQKWEIGQSSPPPYVISMIQRLLEQEQTLSEKGTKSMLKEKFQEQKDIKAVRKDIRALKDIQNQTEKVILEAFCCHGTAVVPYIKTLTPELYRKLEKEREYYSYRMPESVLSSIPEDKLTQEICVEAVKESIFLFDDIPEKFRTYEVYLEYVKHFSRGLGAVPEKYLSPELCKAAVSYDANALQWVPASLQTEEVYDVAFRTNEEQSYYRDALGLHKRVPDNLLQYMCNQTEELCLRAVRQNGMSLKDAKFKTDAVCLAAVSNCGCALQFVENQTKEICFAAADNDRDALMYIWDKDLAQLAGLYVSAKKEA